MVGRELSESMKWPLPRKESGQGMGAQMAPQRSQGQGAWSGTSEGQQGLGRVQESRSLLHAAEMSSDSPSKSDCSVSSNQRAADRKLEASLDCGLELISAA